MAFPSMIRTGEIACRTLELTMAWHLIPFVMALLTTMQTQEVLAMDSNFNGVHFLADGENGYLQVHASVPQLPERWRSCYAVKHRKSRII